MGPFAQRQTVKGIIQLISEVYIFKERFDNFSCEKNK